MPTETTDRAMLEKAADHFVLLKRLASSPGPIRNNGKIVSKWQTVAMECQAAHDKLMEHLNHVEA